MTNIPQRLEKIQQEPQQAAHEVTRERLRDIVAMAREKRHADPSSYYQPSILSRMLPGCYPRSASEGMFKVSIKDMKMENLHEETLFYVFYSFPGDELQTRAYNNILRRKYVFCRLYKCFVALNAPAVPDGAKRSITMFDPFSWARISKDVVFDDRFVGSLESRSI